jgi:hypothetical protein
MWYHGIDPREVDMFQISDVIFHWADRMMETRAGLLV